MFETERELIKECYLPELEVLHNIYLSEYKKFNLATERKIKNLELKLQQVKTEESNDKLMLEIDNIRHIDYSYLASKLQSLVSVWETQLVDFYLVDKPNWFKIIKKKFLNDNLYDIEKDNNIITLRHIDNFLKHGEFGDAKEFLKKTKYIQSNIEFGSLRGKYFCSDTLLIDANDIDFFYNTLKEFWEMVLTNISKYY